MAATRARRPAALFLLALCACAGPSTRQRDEAQASGGTDAPGETSGSSTAITSKVVETTRSKLGRVRGPGDCVAFLRGNFREAGVDLPEAGQPGDNAVTALHRAAVAEGRTFSGQTPVAGDIAFFRETYDRNRDGRRNDGLTHIALVETVDAEGTVSLLHRGSAGAKRIWMDLARPTEEQDAKTGKVLNEPLRRHVPAHLPRLTGELFVTYARFVGPPPLYARAVRSQAAP